MLDRLRRVAPCQPEFAQARVEMLGVTPLHELVAPASALLGCSIDRFEQAFGLVQPPERQGAVAKVQFGVSDDLRVAQCAGLGGALGVALDGTLPMTEIVIHPAEG